MNYAMPPMDPTRLPGGGATVKVPGHGYSNDVRHVEETRFCAPPHQLPISCTFNDCPHHGFDGVMIQ